jgi:hypothetical protein
MTADNIISKPEEIIKKKLINVSTRQNNYDVIPPIIGIIIGDQYGNALLLFEYKSSDSNYKPIRHYLSGNDKDLIELDLISMYFSSFKVFAGQTNIKNLSNLEIHGSNIKTQIYFRFDDYIIIVFLNSNTKLNSKEQTEMVHHLEDLLSQYDTELKNFNLSSSKSVLKRLTKEGSRWLKRLNRSYLKKFQKSYLEKHENIEIFSDKLCRIVENEISEYLGKVDDALIYNLLREINIKVQDDLFNLLP